MSSIEEKRHLLLLLLLLACAHKAKLKSVSRNDTASMCLIAATCCVIDGSCTFISFCNGEIKMATLLDKLAMEIDYKRSI